MGKILELRLKNHNWKIKILLELFISEILFWAKCVVTPLLLTLPKTVKVSKLLKTILTQSNVQNPLIWTKSKWETLGNVGPSEV